MKEYKYKRYEPTFSGQKSSQSEYELSSLIELLKEKKVKRYLEIGARQGDTFYAIVKTVPTINFGIAVDYPGALWGKRGTDHYLVNAIRQLNQNKNIFVQYYLGDSHSKKCHSAIKFHSPYDAILIDGDHTYNGVKRDWELYGDLAPIIAFHDIVGFGEKDHSNNVDIEVPRFWLELKSSLPDVEFKEFVDKHSTMGIGVILK